MPQECQVAPLVTQLAGLRRGKRLSAILKWQTLVLASVPVNGPRELRGGVGPMQDSKNRSTVQVLEDLHTELGSHFSALYAQRKLLTPAAPVFALEHGLSEGDLGLLKNAVRSAVRQGFGAAFRQWWRPFVIYAAESGYEYEGGEYWQTFEESTPWWREHG